MDEQLDVINIKWPAMYSFLLLAYVLHKYARVSRYNGYGRTMPRPIYSRVCVTLHRHTHDYCNAWKVDEKTHLEQQARRRRAKFSRRSVWFSDVYTLITAVRGKLRKPKQAICEKTGMPLCFNCSFKLYSLALRFIKVEWSRPKSRN